MAGTECRAGPADHYYLHGVVRGKRYQLAVQPRHQLAGQGIPRRRTIQCEPGYAGFVAWQTGVSAPSAAFHPDAGTGSYQFQARIRRTTGTVMSGFSAAKGIKVT